MEFGKVSDLNHIEWNLPKDDPSNAKYLASLPAKTQHARFFIGAPAWGHKEWLGKIYPPKTKTSDFLFHYARSFNCIELNTTHYRIPTREQVQNWTQQVPNDFHFCPKLPQLISHDLAGMQDVALIKEWVQSLSYFGANLGPCFLQLPPSFTYLQKKILFRFLQMWPDEYELSIEFRHPSWFEGSTVIPALTQYLQSRAIGLVITDVAGRRDVLHTSVSAPFTLIRFNGNELHASDFSRIKDWSEKLNFWQTLGLQRVYFIVHQPSDFCSPETAEFIIKQFNSVCDAGIIPIQWIG